MAENRLKDNDFIQLPGGCTFFYEYDGSWTFYELRTPEGQTCKSQIVGRPSVNMIKIFIKDKLGPLTTLSNTDQKYDPAYAKGQKELNAWLKTIKE